MPKELYDDELIRLYAEPGQGFSDQALADRLGVDRTAIYKRRKKLENELGIEFRQTERGKYRIDSDKFVSNVRVSWEEALILYLATRRLSRSTRLPKRPVENALGKLATALYKPMTERLVKAAANVPEHPEEKKRTEILRTLIRGWSEQYKVHIRYNPLTGRQTTKHTICPYLIEPSPWSDSVYVIATSNVMDGYVPFQLERIEKATFSTEPFTVDAAFEESTLFKFAWGIWYGDKEPEMVRLKFTGRAAVQRVQESVWHPEQKISQPDEHGHVIWEAPIAEWREMLPWIRGWGSDVEVVEPEGLREAVKGHVWKMTQTYDLRPQATDLDARLLRLWGKTTDDPDRFHPALYHMFDVAHVAQQLLSHRASFRWRRTLAEAIGAKADTLHEWLPYLIALHDIGKISVPFQILNTQQHTRLKTEGFSFGQASRKHGRELHHSIVGRLVAKDVVGDWPDNLKAVFLEMISGHHGVFQEDQREHRINFKRLKEADEWSQLRQQTIKTLQSYFLQQWPDPLPDPANQSTAMMALNGFCILCDWLGSDEAYFKPAPFSTLLEYVPLSRRRACERVRDAGFFQRATSFAPTDFAPLFPDILQPRPLQTAIDAIPDFLLEQPTLTIIEAPTGEGKTEAALALARRIAARRGTDEMYIALPTTATSNAMFERVQEHLFKRLGLPPELVNLVHGQAFLKEDDLPVKAMDSIEPEGETESPSLEWFGPKKKALLAPFGVGTIDQAELSALNVRHNALRMIGLSGKTIILDEVHAYDTYMTTIIKRMLTWLSALGSSVILLSATLPTARRRELARAFAGQQAEAMTDLDAYPSLLTTGSAGHHADRPAAYQPSKIIQLRLTPFEAGNALAKANWLLEQVQAGGCACWMTNTVKRAQQIYAALLDLAPPDVALDLLHARYPIAARQTREEVILERYGKQGDRPGKAVTVGTQVLEQSLDLDFDVMMTDLAPIDLVLQRAGRLHRHERVTAVRHNHQTPHLYVNAVIEKADCHIYDEYILRQSLRTLQSIEAGRLTLPGDYRPLIETVYSDEEPAAGDPLSEAWRKLADKKDGLATEAKQRLMNKPNPDSPFYRGGKFQGFRDDEESSGWLSAPTRWGQESITVIPLIREGKMARLVAGDKAVSLVQKTSRRNQLDLLRQSIRISDPRLVKDLKGQPEQFKLFADSPLLRNCFPLWLERNGDEFAAPNTPLPVRLHPELGLVIGEML